MIRPSHIGLGRFFDPCLAMIEPRLLGGGGNQLNSTVEGSHS